MKIKLCLIILQKFKIILLFIQYYIFNIAIIQQMLLHIYKFPLTYINCNIFENLYIFLYFPFLFFNDNNLNTQGNIERKRMDILMKFQNLLKHL